VVDQEKTMKALLMATAAGTLLTATAMAQTSVVPAPATQASAAPNGSIRQALKADLEKAGFTDITMMPGSFLVQAKSNAGEPVVMMIKPNSITEVVGLGTVTPIQPGAATETVMAPGTFATVPTGERMGSATTGLTVYNDAKQDIGKIKDVAYRGATVQAYIIDVGGFLGMGDHYVAVNPSSVHITWDASAKVWRAAMNTTVDDLKAAPEFKYPSQG
jgi:hypothetical protein